ncbi:NAD(P)-dependent oxidoreductase [Rhodopseudomonas telluris]|uniref:NAD(P)-dependent oxidoreductase n=1 Tax=Rhodopseudomonas telluris TaxID=644215 RepID=A0ABV6ELP0_9BRAD
MGVAGLGRMGSAIAQRLIEVGHEVVVWNRSAEKTKPLAELGVAVAASPKDLVGRAELIITLLTDADAIDRVFGCDEGLLAGSVAGKLFVEMSTVQPSTEQALAQRVAAKGAALLECPVGGTVGPALSGKLLGFAGGAQADFDRAKPILDQLCRRVELMGPIGSGSSMKLAINLPLAVFWQSFGEAYALCRHLGRDAAWMVELFAETSGAPNVLRARGSAVAKALQSQDPGSATFDCDSIRKDLRTMVAEAQALGFSLPLAQQTLTVFDQASQAGWGGRDCTELPAYWSTKHSG